MPVLAPEGTAARPSVPSARMTSTSTVGLPRLSRISRPRTSAIGAWFVLIVASRLLEWGGLPSRPVRPDPVGRDASRRDACRTPHGRGYGDDDTDRGGETPGGKGSTTKRGKI